MDKGLKLTKRSFTQLLDDPVKRLSLSEHAIDETHRQVAFFLREVVLFNGSLKDNFYGGLLLQQVT